MLVFRFLPARRLHSLEENGAERNDIWVGRSVVLLVSGKNGGKDGGGRPKVQRKVPAAPYRLLPNHHRGGGTIWTKPVKY
jgi:hypothetical protein